MGDYYRSPFDGSAWIRFAGIQIGWHPEGRRRYFSERNGHRKGIPTFKVGRTAEVSICKLKKP